MELSWLWLDCNRYIYMPRHDVMSSGSKYIWFLGVLRNVRAVDAASFESSLHYTWSALFFQFFIKQISDNSNYKLLMTEMNSFWKFMIDIVIFFSEDVHSLRFLEKNRTVLFNTIIKLLAGDVSVIVCLCCFWGCKYVMTCSAGFSQGTRLWINTVVSLAHKSPV